MYRFHISQHFRSGHVLVLLVIGLLPAMAGCTGRLSASTPQSQPPLAAPTVARPTVEVLPTEASAQTMPAGALSYTGDVRAKHQVSVTGGVPGRIQEIRVEVGDKVKAGDVIAVLDSEQLDLQVRQAEAGLAAARATLAKAEAGARPEQIKMAEAGVKVAEAALSLARRGPTETQIAVVEHQVAQAKNGLWAAQSARNQICGSKEKGANCDAAKAQVGVAWEGVQMAEQQLQGLKEGASWQQIQQAQAGLDAARQQLELARNPMTEEDLTAIRAQVQMAEISLEMAKRQRDEATITAPVDGIIASRTAEVGAMAGGASLGGASLSAMAGSSAGLASLSGGGGGIVTIISEDVEIVFPVEAAVYTRIATGQPVKVQADAYPGLEFTGRVTHISPTADTVSRRFNVTVAPDDSDHKLRPGMFANILLEVK
ncbi:MAG: HlyD family secretion protein [Anaerolineae bacterium]